MQRGKTVPKSNSILSGIEYLRKTVMEQILLEVIDAKMIVLGHMEDEDMIQDSQHLNGLQQGQVLPDQTTDLLQQRDYISGEGKSHRHQLIKFL